MAATAVSRLLPKGALAIAIESPYGHITAKVTPLPTKVAANNRTINVISVDVPL